MRLAPQDEDLVRWLYVIARFPRAQLARDFECAIDDIEEIISSGLGRMLNPGSNADKRKPLATPPQMETVSPRTEREWLMDIFRRALT